MATTFESQRLISVSLGKIAQSRGQRGGINLHKNLLVATVLHKARTAYMMESYTYQQNLQRQQQREQSQLAQQSARQSQQQQQCQAQQQKDASSTTNPTPMCVDTDQSSVSSPQVVPEIAQPQTCPSNESRDAEMGQPDATRTDREECRADNLSDAPVAMNCPHQTPEHESPDSVSITDPVVSKDNDRIKVNTDKENSPPSATTESIDFASSSIAPPIDHTAAATQLAHDSTPCNATKPSLTSGSLTCNVLKRRRENQSAACTQPLTLDIEMDHPTSKKARLATSGHDDATKSPSHMTELSASPDPLRGSSLPQGSDSDQELVYTNLSEPQSLDSPQISNLVNIFNSGFSGLCAVSSSSSTPSAGSDSDSSSLNASHSEYNLVSRPVLTRQDSISCSSQLGRMDSVPSAIILSA